MSAQSYRFTLEPNGYIKFNHRFVGGSRFVAWPESLTFSRKVSKSVSVIFDEMPILCEFHGNTFKWSHPNVVNSEDLNYSERWKAEEAVENVVSQLNVELLKVFSPHKINDYLSTEIFYQSIRQVLPPTKSQPIRNWRNHSQNWIENFLSESEENFQNNEGLVANLPPTDSFSRILQILSKKACPGKIKISMEKKSEGKKTKIILNFSNEFDQPRFFVKRDDTSARVTFKESKRVSQLNAVLASYMLVIAMVYQLTLSDLSDILEIEAFLDDESSNLIQSDPNIKLKVDRMGWIDGLMSAQKLRANQLIESEIGGVVFSK